MLVLSSSSLTSSTPPFSNTSVVVLQRRTGTIMLRSLPMTAALVSISPLQGTQHVPRQRMSKTNMCLCFSKLKIMADKEVDLRRDADMMLFRHQTPLDIRSGQELLSRLKKESEYGRLPGNVASALEELYENYRNAVFSSENPHAEEIFLSNMSAMLDCVLLDLEDPFIFPPYHKAVRKPYDYYAFGQNFMRPLIDFGSSYVGNIAIFHEMEEKRQQGHNIILMSNHQTEADPAIIASLLEGTNPYIAENTTYVAGDRVVTDPLCKPFSMGRNLICVYSKKHMYDVPELVDMKKRANTRSLKEMALLLRGGSQIIWIAPSGGRDRPDPVTDEWYPAPFDISSVDNMRRLMEHAGVPGHVYPLSILCYDIMPPPPQVEKEIGEKRLMSFHGVGLSVAPEISYHNVALHCRNEEEVKSAYADILYDTVNEQYKVLKAAIHGKQGFGASTPAVLLSQPWRPN